MTAGTAEHHRERPLLAIGLRLLAMAALSTMFMLVKVASQRGVSLPELIFWRQAMAVPLIFGWLLATRQVGILRTRRMVGHAMRATTGTAGLCCNVAAASLLPLPLATTLGFTAPLFAVMITGLVLRHKVGHWRWTAVVLGFVGVLIIARPDGTPVPALGVAAGLGAGVVVAVVSFQIRDLARTEAPIACVFWFSFYGAVMTAAVLPFFARPHGGTEWLLLVAIGLFGTLAQTLITASLRFGQVATVVVMDYTSLIWATLYGWAIWGGLPGVALALGAPVIVAAGLIITWREHHLARRIAPLSSLDETPLREDPPRGPGGT